MLAKGLFYKTYGLVFLTLLLPFVNSTTTRVRTSLNNGWTFMRTTKDPDKLAYDQRPDTLGRGNITVLKSWVLPSANDFIEDPTKRYKRPESNLTVDIPFVQNGFDDSTWEFVNLPHDWAIKGPFYAGDPVVVGGGMGRLPSQGIAWYRRKLSMATADEGKTVYLDIDGAMSYAMVWLNGNLVGGWPYGYNSFRLDLTPYLVPGDNNQLAIRLDNPTDSSRWYPGGGLYRNVWLTKVSPVHIAQWGTYITTRVVSTDSATLDLVVQVDNKASNTQLVELATTIYTFDAATERVGEKAGDFPTRDVTILPDQKQSINSSIKIRNPRLWGPPPSQAPNLYIAITQLSADGKVIDTYKTVFGVRAITYDANQGLLVNGKHVPIQGVNQHHDLGALGSAFNIRAAERQLEVLQDMGCNAIRMAHNPPAPELLELTDKMGFLVVDEIFDCWERAKTSSDFHLIFPDWQEPDLRSMLRRDRNHPSVIIWSIGNEVGEQTTGVSGAAIAERLHNIVREEDPTRQVMASMNAAQPNMSFPAKLDLISLNYQGEGIRDAPAYSHLTTGIHTPPMYPAFHAKFPQAMIFSSETAAALSTRGTYFFPVTDGISAPVNDSSGGNSALQQVSAYELYTADFGSSPDKVFSSQDHASYVAGEFVWSGWDYLGEPTPYYSSRSSYFGMIDLAGFKKDRFFLYQSRWRPDHPMAHILPHWNWPDRIGQVTPVHVFSSADEAELFVNGISQGRQNKTAYEYRFRWDHVVYQPGDLQVLTYKQGKAWANETVRTTYPASQLQLTAERSVLIADGLDLSFVKLEILDSRGDLVQFADTAVTFSVSGGAEIVATDNGNPADLTAFSSKTRKTLSGFALVIIRAKPKSGGSIIVSATSDGLSAAQVTIQAV
ncbi:glycoside hydrolase superfamily [Leptodontidium sp. 2 PMI_412]|nr:glycoside hydrolase superfamily [Leptodontidium sp. 2 PMI_412]